MKILSAKILRQYVLDDYIIPEYYFEYYKSITKAKTLFISDSIERNALHACSMYHIEDLYDFRYQCGIVGDKNR